MDPMPKTYNGRCWGEDLGGRATAGLAREPLLCKAPLSLRVLQGPGLEKLRPLTSPGYSGLFCVHTPPQIGLSGERAECLPFFRDLPWV